jgi:hypothetical protein
MSNPIAVVAEGPSDFEVATKLIDETLLRTVEWISESDIDAHRIYVSRTDNEPFVRWRSVEIDRGNDYRRAVRQTFGGPLPRHEVSFRIQRVVYEFTSLSSDTGRPTPFIVVLKDTDAKDDARQAIQEARNQFPAIVVGMLHTEMECWLIAAFEPLSETETARLADICRGDGPGVGFDPRSRSEELTATKREHEKLSPKRVLRFLAAGDRSRELNGLAREFHSRLKDRGKGNGLAEFLSDLEMRLVRSAFDPSHGIS